MLKRPGEKARRFSVNACPIYQAADTALKVKTVHDFTAVATVAVTPERDVLVLDMARDRVAVPDQLGYLFRLRDRWRSRWMALEDAASGAGLIESANRAGRPFRIAKADVDKVARATPVAVLAGNGGPYSRHNAEWLADFEAELLSFPNARHDDMVDALAHVVREALEGPNGAALDMFLVLMRKEQETPVTRSAAVQEKGYADDRANDAARADPHRSPFESVREPGGDGFYG